MTTVEAGGNFELQVTLSMRKLDSTAFGNAYVTGNNNNFITEQQLNQFIKLNAENDNEATVEKAKFQPGSMLGALIKLNKEGSPRANKM